MIPDLSVNNEEPQEGAWIDMRKAAICALSILGVGALIYVGLFVLAMALIPSANGQEAQLLPIDQPEISGLDPIGQALNRDRIRIHKLEGDIAKLRLIVAVQQRQIEQLQRATFFGRGPGLPRRIGSDGRPSQDARVLLSDEDVNWLNDPVIRNIRIKPIGQSVLENPPQDDEVTDAKDN